MEFPPFRIDRQQGRLWRGEEAIPLRRKTWDVLIYLASRPGELVTKEDLLAAVWGDTTVTENVITNCVLELRRALGDDRRAPRFIEVVYRRGFRWIPIPKSAPHDPPAAESEDQGGDDEASRFVGRAMELARLRDCWLAAIAGRRQVVLISGEPGIGKTAVVDHFITGLAVRGLGVTGQRVHSSPNPQPLFP